jgi:hypothetical protein
VTFDERMVHERRETQRVGMDLSAQLALSIARNEMRRVLASESRRATTEEQSETILRIKRELEASFERTIKQGRVR